MIQIKSDFHLRKVSISIVLTIIVVLIYCYCRVSPHLFVPTSILLLNNDSFVEINSSVYYNIRMPCIEPHCDIQCLLTYNSHGNDGVIRSNSLTKLEEEHLMIDLGEDRIVNKLIESNPRPKSCLYNQLSNVSVDFYPILFGFVDEYLPKSRSHQVLINNQFKSVEQMCLPRKTKSFSDLLPGQVDTYKFDFTNELDYRRSYSTAYFAITMKKGGWDCNRHYEIITSGTMPFFDRLNQSGQSTLALLPKSILYEAQDLDGVHRHDLTIDWKRFDVNRYHLLLHRLLYYAKQRLTTHKLVEYILNVIKYPLNRSKKHSVLFVSHYEPDYLKDFLLHGFTKVFEEDVHVFQGPRYLYDYPLNRMWTDDETKDYYQRKLYGFGYGYKLSLKKYFHLYERDRQVNSNETFIENNIRMKRYSLIVFGSILRENRFYSLVRNHYEQSKVVLLDGEDEGKDQRRKDFLRWGIYFLREIPDDCDQII